MLLVEWILKVDPAKIEFMRRYDKQGWSPIEDITHLPFIFIKRDIPKYIENSQFEQAFCLTLSKSMEEVMKIPPLDRFRLLLWLQHQYAKINKMEESYLFSPPDIKLVGAGIKDLDVLGITNTIDMLAGGDVTKWAEVEQLPYSVCFEKQLKSTIEKRIEKKLIEQSKRK